MRRIPIFVLAVLLLASILINAKESHETEITGEALPNDVTGTWVAINSGLTNEVVHALAINPTNPSVIYIGTNGGVFKSTNWGENWSVINNGLTNTTQVWALAIDPSNPSTIYAGTNGGVFKSTNGGGIWSAINGGLTNTYVIALAIDPSNPNTIYAGSQSGVFQSTDGGTSWGNLSMPYIAVGVLAIDPSNPNTIYAGTEHEVYKSTDGGKVWTYRVLSCPVGYTYALAIDPSNPSTIYIGSDCAVFKSTSWGGNWLNILAATCALALAIDPTDPGILYAGTWGLGIFKSTDGGVTWNAINNGLANMSVNALAIDPTNPSVMYAGTSGGVFKSFPAGSLSLNVSKSGAGDGSVTSNPSGIDCGSTCTGNYNQGTSVTLTAAPSSGSIFAGWSGECSGTGDCVVTMDDNKLVIATFNLQGQSGVNVSITPGSLNFGAVNVGQSLRQTITITNQANSTATLTGSVGSLSGPFSVVSGGGVFNLAAGQSMTVTVLYSPTTAGAADASLSITHNATDQLSPTNVPLSGTGISTTISVTPTAEDYGGVKVKRSKTASFKVKNTGKGDLYILYSRIMGPDGPMFAITSGQWSKILHPGNSLTIKVVFKPTSTGSKSATLEITSNNPVTPTIDIPLSGTGQ